MAGDGEKRMNGDANDNTNANDDNYYSVLGLNKQCTHHQLRTAYKNLALRWHPDRFSASGNPKYVEESKIKFQAIQQAYSVLSDTNKRFMYDVGVYDHDDDDNGMGDFLNEMANMMTQNKSNENVDESFDELKALFEDMFQNDVQAAAASCHSESSASCSSSMFESRGEHPSPSNKRNFEVNLRKSEVDNTSTFDASFQGFCVGAGHQENHQGAGYIRGEGKSRRGRKQKVSSGHDVSSSNNAGIST